MTTELEYMYFPEVLPKLGQAVERGDWKWNDNIKRWVKTNDAREEAKQFKTDALSYLLRTNCAGTGGSKAFQVGGDHYKKAKASNMQPWDIIDAWELDYYAGTVLKYLLRYKYKNGKEDLKKARHFLDKMIEDYDDNENN